MGVTILISVSTPRSLYDIFVGLVLHFLQKILNVTRPHITVLLYRQEQEDFVHSSTLRGRPATVKPN